MVKFNFVRSASVALFFLALFHAFFDTLFSQNKFGYIFCEFHDILTILGTCFYLTKDIFVLVLRAIDNIEICDKVIPVGRNLSIHHIRNKHESPEKINKNRYK